MSIGRAQNPRIGLVHVDEGGYSFEYEDTIHGIYGIPVGTANKHDVGVYFANIDRLDLDTKDTVRVIGTNGEKLQEIEFKTTQDAERFIDAVAAMREQRLRMDHSPDGTQTK